MRLENTAVLGGRKSNAGGWYFGPKTFQIVITDWLSFVYLTTGPPISARRIHTALHRSRAVSAELGRSVNLPRANLGTVLPATHVSVFRIRKLFNTHTSQPLPFPTLPWFMDDIQRSPNRQTRQGHASNQCLISLVPQVAV